MSDPTKCPGCDLPRTEAQPETCGWCHRASSKVDSYEAWCARRIAKALGDMAKAATDPAPSVVERLETRPVPELSKRGRR